MMADNFNFGKNWREFSKNYFGEQQYLEAKKSLKELVGSENIQNATFLDIGSGSGIFSLAAKDLGATKVLGVDISKDSLIAAQENNKKYPNIKVDFKEYNILNNQYQSLGNFKIVYSWGVLHHTGDMWKAIDHASNLVSEKGLFVIALYNKHWSSPYWKLIKAFYNSVPNFIQKILIWIFYPIIYLAKFLVTRKNPFNKERGMSFYYDVIDWVGGYPYEYASVDEVVQKLKKKNFRLLKTNMSAVPTGCTEFVFSKNS